MVVGFGVWGGRNVFGGAFGGFDFLGLVILAGCLGSLVSCGVGIIWCLLVFFGWVLSLLVGCFGITGS